MIPSPLGGGGTPLVMVFQADGHAEWETGGALPFEFEPGHPTVTAWPKSSTPWLVRDLNGNGRVDSGRELFGSYTCGHRKYAHGFQALSALDDNGDGVIDENDAAFSSLALWRDSNHNRRTDEGELQRLSDAGVRQIGLTVAVAKRCDPLGNCEIERGSFVFRGPDGLHQTGTVIDLHLVVEHVFANRRRR